MKKSFRRLFAVALSAITVVSGAFALASCGGSSAIKIGVPDDATNQSRAIKLLETAGLIEVDPAAGYTPEIKDITKYLYNIEIVPAQANTLPSTLGDYGASTINGTYASPAGLIPSKDALIIESQGASGENPYVNIIAARSEDKNNETYQTIVKAFQTQIVAQYLLEAYNEVYFPSFEYNKDYTVDKNFVTEITNYKSSPDGKTEVKVGVCGANNLHWNAVQKVLDEQNANIYIKLVEFDAYNLPNQALANKEIDLNSFQHKAYLNKEISAQGYALESIGDTLIAPLSLYSRKYDSLDALKAAAGVKENA